MAISDDIRRMSDELARDPGSRVFLPLGEALRRQGQPDLALKLAQKGVERHPHFIEAHDLLAKVFVDKRDFEHAAEEWDTVLRLSPGHLGALKGLGFISYQRERFSDAERYLAAAATNDPADHEVASALLHVQSARLAIHRAAAMPSSPQMPEDSRYLFHDILVEDTQTALLLDSQGLVLGGMYYSVEGEDVGEKIGAELSGVTDAARRATRHLVLGDWTSIVFETDVAVVALAPAEADGLLVVATTRDTPLGLVRRLLDRCSELASRWLRGIG
jgi:predicted regulator of Ras-like GTPase activity (Roadblock/LC7/MglB family)